MIFYIDPKICPQNHVCPLVKLCPIGAIQQNQDGLPVIDAEKCIQCGKCLRSCPMRAVVRV